MSTSGPLGFSDFDLTTGLPPVDGRIPRGRSQGLRRHLPGARRGGLAQADKIIVKTPHEAMGIPTKEANAQGLKATRQIINMLDEQTICADNEAVRREAGSSSGRSPASGHVFDAGDGDLAQGHVPAFEAGVLDVPFAPSIHCRGKILPMRDNEGFIRIFAKGQLPLSEEIWPITATGWRSGPRPKSGPSASRWSPTTSTPSARASLWGGRDEDPESHFLAGHVGVLLRRPAGHQGRRRRTTASSTRARRVTPGFTRIRRPGECISVICSSKTARSPWAIAPRSNTRARAAATRCSWPTSTCRSWSGTSGRSWKDRTIGTFRDHGRGSSRPCEFDGRRAAHRPALRPVTQALLDARALERRTALAEVVCEEYGLPMSPDTRPDLRPERRQPLRKRRQDDPQAGRRPAARADQQRRREARPRRRQAQGVHPLAGRPHQGPAAARRSTGPSSTSTSTARSGSSSTRTTRGPRRLPGRPASRTPGHYRLYIEGPVDMEEKAPPDRGPAGDHARRCGA